MAESDIDSSQSKIRRLQIRVGIFTVVGLVAIAGISVFVNDRPYWWRSCNLVFVNVEDATGLKAKSPVRSLGLEIGYLQSVHLADSLVRLGVCITAPVEVLPTTRAYIRGEGFLGDKFLELKPVKYSGKQTRVLDGLFSVAYAAENSVTLERGTGGRSITPTREIPVEGGQGQDVQQVVNQVNHLVGEMTSLTNNLRSAINPEELKKTMTQLNAALENASKTLSPQGGLTTTAQRTLSKLEDAIEQLKDVITRVNQGKGSLGMLLNDPKYADEIGMAIRNLNRLLNRVGEVLFVINFGAESLPARDGGRGWVHMAIWPRSDRYYLLGLGLDYRGQLETTVTRTLENGILKSDIVKHETKNGSFNFTAMFGKVFWKRWDLSAGILHGDGTASVAWRMGPASLDGSLEEQIQLRGDLYGRMTGTDTGTATRLDGRVQAIYFPWSSVFVKGGLDSFRDWNKVPFSIGAGIHFEDEDVRILFTFL